MASQKHLLLIKENSSENANSINKNTNSVGVETWVQQQEKEIWIPICF